MSKNICAFIVMQLIFLLLQHFPFENKRTKESQSLELDHLALSLLISSQFRMPAPLNGQHPLGSVIGLNTFKPPHNLLCGFNLLPENRLCLPTVATLLPIIAPCPLGVQGSLPFLYWVTSWGWCFPRVLQKPLWVLSTLTIFAVKLSGTQHPHSLSLSARA